MVETIIFDQYSRYRACSQIIDALSHGKTVLDVGSGPECLLGCFLPEHTITYVDPLLTNWEVREDERVIGNVFDSTLNDREFDCVCSVDTLEHIPPEQRIKFLRRLSVLSKDLVVLGFPTCDSTAAPETDKAIDAKYRAIFGRDYPWLEEHHRYGLPSLAETVDHLGQLGWYCQTVGHGHAPWLEELLGFVICAWDIPGLRDVVLEVSDRFNRELYSYDFEPPYYRQFVIAARRPLPPIAIQTSTGNRSSAESSFRAMMEECQRRYFRASMRQLTEQRDAFVERDAAVAERDAAVAERDTAVAERDAAVAERDTAVAERDAAVAERDAAVAERDTVVPLTDMIRSSHSWRITRPLRFAGRVVRYGLLNDDRRRIVQGLRAFYHRLPLPPLVKKALSWSYHDIIRKTFSALQRHVSTEAAFSFPSVKPAEQKAGVPDYIIWGVIDWHFRYQRPQHLAQALAASGRRVFYVSPCLVDDKRAGFEAESINADGCLFQIKLFATGAPVIYSSGPRVETVSQLRASIGEVLVWADSRQVVSLVQHPFWYDIATVLPNSRVVYDCIDHHEGFGNNGMELLSLERALLRDADLTVTTSAWLDQIVAEHAKRRALIRNACQFEHFARQPEKTYLDPQGRRIIGYYGAIAEWFDQDLVEAVAKRFPECCVLLVGADTVNARAKLGKLANAKFVGEVPYAELPYYLYGFDVCLLPFKIIPLTLATNPVKAYEYLSAGKPVVSVKLPEMAQFGDLIRTAENSAGFLSAVADALNSVDGAAEVARRQAFARGQTWVHRVDALIANAENSCNDPKVSVVVVTYNNLHLTRDCLASIDEHSNYDNLEVIVVDNASSDGTQEFLSDWVSASPDRKLILNEDNRGFAAANNQGLAIASGEYLVLLNNDTYVTPGWVRTLVKHLQRDKSIGLIGPVTNNIGNEAKIDLVYESMGEMLSASSRYTRRHIGQTFPLRNTAFFCVMMPHSVYEQVGTLDEAFGRGFFEDDDYCRRVEQLGLRVVCAEDVFIHHHLSASFNKLESAERQALFEQNKAIYEAKWGMWLPHVYSRQDMASMPSMFKGALYLSGYCNVCGNTTRFFYTDAAMWRESLTCEHCLTTSRYRSIARGILRAIKEQIGVDAKSLASLSHTGRQWKLRIYDTQSPFRYETCAYPLPDLLKEAGWIDITLSQYKPKLPMGERLAPGVTNQNLESLTFSDASFDIVITSDVMEHVRLDDRAHREIYRVLRPGGIYIFTVPHNRSWEKNLVRVQIVEPDDPLKDIHLLEPEYHGDANSEEGTGVLAYRTYGREIEIELAKLGFEVEYSRDDVADQGILNTELYYCRKVDKR